jgi:GT2 family glycosyltransferase
MSLTIAFSTRELEESYIDHIKKTSGIKNIEILSYKNPNGESLTKIYNKALEESKNDIIVFCHDDIIFNTKKWGKRLLKHFSDSDYGILGLAGTRKLPESGSWWEDINQPMSNMVGIVNHSQNGKTWESKYSQPVLSNIIPVVILDGLFFAVDRTRIKKHFNEEVDGFHFYDIDFTFTNHLEGVKIGVITNIRITHKSMGQTNEEWEKNRLEFISRHADNLPAEVDFDLFYTNKELTLKKQPKLSIIIPTKDNIDILFNCLNSIYEKTTYTNFEIVVADTGSEKENLEKMREFCNSNNRTSIVEFDYYNFAQINNEVVYDYVSDDTELVLFCNNDIELINDAISRMVSVWQKNKKKVGTVGARLHFEDNTVQHGGMLLWLKKDWLTERGLTRIEITHYNLRQGYKHVLEGTSPVVGNTGAFLLIQKDLFTKVGGFNPTYIECFEDAELNFSVLLEGKVNLFVSDAVAYHYESKTRNKSDEKLERLQEDYRERLFPFIGGALGDRKKATYLGQFINVVQ